MNLTNRIKRLEKMAVAAAQKAKPPEPPMLTNQQLLFINNDPKAIEAARYVADAYAAQVQAPGNWPMRDNVKAMFQKAVKADPKVLEAWNYFGTVQQAAVAASTT